MTHHRRVAIWLLRPPTPDVLVHPIRRREPGTLRGCRLALSVPCGKSILSTSLVQVIYAHSLNRLPHQPFDPTGDLELTSTGRAADFKPVEADLGVIVHRRRVHRSRCQRVERDHVSPALLGDTDELLFSCLIVDQRKRCLMKLEGTHLFELFFYPATAFKG